MRAAQPMVNVNCRNSSGRTLLHQYAIAGRGEYSE